MEKTKFGHIVINIHMKNSNFYKELFTFLGWSVLYDAPEVLGVGAASGESVWFSEPIKPLENDYDGIGMNHFGISAPSIAAVDETVAFLTKMGVPSLFETPRHRPEFSGPGDTYYQVMFESPDRILFEVVYTGPK
jgi:catechol 2,3-dioxygenase-like lactoylglutathione lyase family enzyme